MKKIVESININGKHFTAEDLHSAAEIVTDEYIIGREAQMVTLLDLNSFTTYMAMVGGRDIMVWEFGELN